MSGLGSTISPALVLCREKKGLIFRAVRIGFQESPIPPMPTTVSEWAPPASATQTCVWPSTAMFASTSQEVGSGLLAWL